MRFIVDAQLPRRVIYRLQSAGHDAIHTLDLPKGNRTPDTEITEVAIHEGRVVVTKDADFVNSFWLAGRPPKLLLVSTGNITNVELEACLLLWLHSLEQVFATSDFVELTRSRLVIHA